MRQRSRRSNDPNAADGSKILAEMPRKLAAADLGRYADSLP
jgi:hypothetical protein